MISLTGPIGFDGNECQAVCPAGCGADDMSCYGGKDSNGCERGDFCYPAKGCIFLPTLMCLLVAQYS